MILETIMNIVKKKYFFVVLSFIGILVFSFAMYFTIMHDIQSGQPLDDLPRAEAMVVNSPDIYTVEENGNPELMYTNIQIYVEISDKESYTSILVGQVSKSSVGELNYGSRIKVKYSDNDHSTFFFANDPEGEHHTFLYILFSLLIIACIIAMIISSRKVDYKTQQKIMEENIRRVREENERNAGFENSPGGENVFDTSIDYNAMYQQDQFLRDSTFSADDTFSGYGNSDGDTSGSRSPGAPAGSPYGGNEAYSGYGAPNASMDAPLDPNATYGGYGAPNASMDAPFDPNATYGGYGAPNASMDAPFDPNAPYGGY